MIHPMEANKVIEETIKAINQKINVKFDDNILLIDCSNANVQKMIKLLQSLFAYMNGKIQNHDHVCKLSVSFVDEDCWQIRVRCGEIDEQTE